MNSRNQTQLIRAAKSADLSVESAIPSNRVVRNTYLLLSLTLLFSALTAGASMALNLPAGIHEQQ